MRTLIKKRPTILSNMMEIMMSNSLTATSAVSKQNIQTTWIDTLTFTTKTKKERKVL